MGRDLVADQRLQHHFEAREVSAFAQHDMGHDDLGADGIGLAHNSGHDHIGMGQERLFDLDRADTVACRGDHIIIAGMEGDLALSIVAGQIAGVQPTIDPFARCRFGFVPVAQEHHRIGGADADLADLASTDGAICIAQADLMARHRQAHRPRLAHHHAIAGGDDEICLGLAVEFIDRAAQDIAPPIEQIAAQRLAARADGAQGQV